ncbi:MAG: hypothetical protein SFV32_14035 [Opitutaceae bacterium]|nr:hypothetical protein [Opitutaceae bacterium]
MKRIEVKLSLDVVAPLLDVIKEASDSAEKRLIVPIGEIALDHDMKEVWESDLLAKQAEELHALLALFDSHFFATGTVLFDSSNAESVVRACSAARLLLREGHLRDLQDEHLESGDIDLEALPTQIQKAFLCYVFLATLQDLIIQHLDRAILGQEEE